jgi:hypothetical protein
MTQIIVPAAQALQRLRAGSERFVSSVRSIDVLVN